MGYTWKDAGAIHPELTGAKMVSSIDRYLIVIMLAILLTA